MQEPSVETLASLEAKLSTLPSIAEAKLASIQTRGAFEQLKAQFLGPNGQLTTVSKTMGSLSPEEKPKLGKAINNAKKDLEALFKARLDKITQAEKLASLGPKVIDPTLPVEPKLGLRHPLSLLKEEILSALKPLGFSFAEGPEIETEWYCFDALNTPADHPARDMQDTLFLDPATPLAHRPLRNKDLRNKERYILRTHTSNVQVRKMLESPPPLRVATIGRCYRRDAVDATHSANFHQLEGLYVDEKVSLKDLKNTLDYFLKSLLGEGVETRLRPSFFPFTEPSYEVDVRLPHIGKLSNQWLEILGCGLVDPKVFEAVGYDSQRWRGFAWGMGLERLAMIRYRIEDIRYFYQNDTRFLEQFNVGAKRFLNRLNT